MVDAKVKGPPKDTWRTPPDLLRLLEDRFCLRFTLDPCSAPDNHLGLESFFTEEDDGLSRAWFGTVWVNPPFSNKWEWVSKAFLEAVKRRVESWILIENVTDSRQFHSWAPLCIVYLLRGRIAFLGEDLKPIGNGFRGSMLLRFGRGRGEINLLDLQDRSQVS